MAFLPNFALSEENYRFERMWPTLQQPWYFSEPKDIAVDRSGNIYIVDSGYFRVQKFTVDGKFITNWGSKGSSDGQFGGGNWSGPDGIAVNDKYEVFVGDPYNCRIQKLTKDGKFLLAWGRPGSGPGEFGLVGPN